MDLTKKVVVRNRNSGTTGYTIPALRIHRKFAPPGKAGDFNYVPVSELIELTTVPGGMYILQNLLIIEDEEARNEVLGVETVPEYNYTEKEIYYLLHGGTNAQLLDALDFAPKGVLELIKELAMQNLPDTMEKITAINNKFSIDIIKLHEKLTDTVVETATTTEETGRRSEPVAIPKPTTTTVPKYNVVSK